MAEIRIVFGGLFGGHPLKAIANNYGWLSEKEREAFSLFALSLMNVEGKTFQQRLENAAFLLINETSFSRKENGDALK